MSDILELDSEKDQYFPNHGWVENVKGIRLLVFPILRLYQYEQPYRDIYVNYKIGGTWLQFRSPYRTLNNLAVCFRDLHKELREIKPLHSQWSADVSKERNIDLTRLTQGQEKIEVLLIAAFTLLRRLGDEIVDVTRPLLFENWHSAPREMKKIIKFTEEEKLAELKPTCDLEILINALTNNTEWFNKLRTENGIRDIIIHKPHMLQVGGQGSKKENESDVTWKTSAHIVRTIDGKITAIDLFKYLTSCVDGACEFMKEICKTVNLKPGYYDTTVRRGGFIFLSGSDNDIAGIWPPITEKRKQFPLME